MAKRIRVINITKNMWFKSIKEAAAYAQVDGWTMSKKMEASGSFIDNNGDEYIRETPMRTKNKYKNTGKKLCKAGVRTKRTRICKHTPRAKIKRTDKMIERLKTLEDDEIDMSVGATNTRFADTELVRKINELIDAVNELQKDYDNVCVWVGEQKLKAPAENVQPDAESRPENVQDKFAEQRRWIGMLCMFWDIDNNNLYYGPLTKIHDTSPYCYECNHKMCYANCEPVKDDIIYKGGDNE